MTTPTILSPMAALDDGSFSLSAPAVYADVSLRSLRDDLDGSPDEAVSATSSCDPRAVLERAVTHIQVRAAAPEECLEAGDECIGNP